MSLPSAPGERWAPLDAVPAGLPPPLPPACQCHRLVLDLAPAAPACGRCPWIDHKHAWTPCRKSTEVLRINLRSGRLELENDVTAESSYENEVGTGRSEEVGWVVIGSCRSQNLEGRVAHVCHCAWDAPPSAACLFRPWATRIPGRPGAPGRPRRRCVCLRTWTAHPLCSLSRFFIPRLWFRGAVAPMPCRHISPCVAQCPAARLQSEALDHLQARGYELVERGCALLGYAVAGPTAGLLLATRVREKAVLPGGHTVYAVTDSQWTLVPLQVRSGAWQGGAGLLASQQGWSSHGVPVPGAACCRGSRMLPIVHQPPVHLPALFAQNEAADAALAATAAGLPPPRAAVAAQEFWRALQQFTLNNAHYYCETADISRPFPRCPCPAGPLFLPEVHSVAQASEFLACSFVGTWKHGPCMRKRWLTGGVRLACPHAASATPGSPTLSLCGTAGCGSRWWSWGFTTTARRCCRQGEGKRVECCLPKEEGRFVQCCLLRAHVVPPCVVAVVT